MAASLELVTPSSSTLVHARPENPVRVSAGSSPVSYGTTRVVTDDTIAARATETFTEDVYIRSDGHVVLERFAEWDAQEHDEAVTDTETTLNVKEFGARGDGVTDDSTAIQAALDAAAATGADGSSQGGDVFLPKGTYRLGSQITVPNKVRLAGSNRSASVLKATSGFSTDTALVRLGDGTSIVFAARLENLTVDCNAISGSIGVYSNEAQEQSGVFNCVISSYRNIGIDFADGASIVGVENVEVYPGDANTTAGIRFTDVEGQSFVHGATIGSNVGYAMTDGIKVVGSQVDLVNTHFEGCTDGIDIDANSVATITSSHGHSTTTTLIRIAGGAYVTVLGAIPNSSTSTVVGISTQTGIVGLYAETGVEGTVIYGTGGAGHAMEVKNTGAAALQAAGSVLRVEAVNGTDAGAVVRIVNGGTGQALLAGGDVEIDGALNHDGSTVGFYGTTPVAQQTGVAVSAAGIHAALVNLGLITA